MGRFRWSISTPTAIPGARTKSGWTTARCSTTRPRNGRSIQVGIRTHNEETHGFNILHADQVHEKGVAATVAEIQRVVGDNKAYLTFDIDCLDPSFAPGTGTPVCGGLSTAQALGILRGLTPLGLVAMDLVEVAPVYDSAEITSLAGATLALEYLCVLASKRA